MDDIDYEEYVAAAQLFEDDISSLIELTFKNGPVLSRHVRQASVIVRRWLCDGDFLQKIARPLGIAKVTTQALSDEYEISSAKLDPDIQYYISAGVRFNGLPVGFLYYSSSGTFPEWAGPSSQFKLQEVTLKAALRKEVLYHDGSSFRMEEVLRFVANKTGGAHLDNSRKPRQVLLEKAANFVTFGGPLESLSEEPKGEIHMALEPMSQEAMSGANIAVVAAATMLLNLKLDGVPFAEIQKTDAGIEIGLSRLPRKE